MPIWTIVTMQAVVLTDAFDLVQLRQPAGVTVMPIYSGVITRQGARSSSADDGQIIFGCHCLANASRRMSTYQVKPQEEWLP
jgi:hypothetical protein